MAKLRSRTNGIGLIGHVVAGYPSVEEGMEIVGVLAHAGASAIEIQIPFSEPIADGPLFLAANQQALAQGMDIDRSLEFFTRAVQAFPAVQFVAMTYANVLYRRGIANMCQRLKDAGAFAVICPDWPADARDDLLGPLKLAQLSWVPLIAPTTSLERAKFLLDQGDGFAYVVAREGVTGTRSAISPHLKHRLADLQKLTDLPLAVGFGIQTGSDVAALRGSADFAIIGSQSLSMYRSSGIEGLKALWASFRESCQV